MCRSEGGSLPPPLTAEETLKWRNKRASENMEIAKVTEFHSDTDVKLKLNKLRILGVYPVPDTEDMNVLRAFLTGFYSGVRETVKIHRSGGIA